MNEGTRDAASQLSKKKRFSRVSRACTECRVRKIRCDGRQPCQPCEDFDRHCSYISTKAQKTGGAPRTKILEDRLRRARTLISQLQTQQPSLRYQAEVDAIFESPPASPSTSSETPRLTSEDEREAIDLQHVTDGQGGFLLVDDKRTEFYGSASGLAFLRVAQQFLGEATATDRGSRESDFGDHTMLHLFDTPLSDKQTLRSNTSVPQLLPCRKTALRLLHVVFNQTYPLLYFLHQPTFQASTNRIYENDQLDFTDADREFIPLFLAVIAVGYLFDQKQHHDFGCERAIDEATKHFLAARRMIDILDCHNLLDLQTNICLTLFLISTGRLFAAHTLVGLAVSSAMRMGLHSQASSDSFSKLDLEMRRRVLWTIVKVDIYVTTTLGLPISTNLNCIDQPRPDGNVKDYQFVMPNMRESDTSSLLLAASAQYLDLLMIMAKVMQKLYPNTEDNATQFRRGQLLTINATTISEIESEFATWREGLSTALDAANQPQTSILASITYELEMAHNLGHILLYCPFMHYLARMNSDDPPEKHQLQCAASCIKIARISIQRSDQVLRKGSLATAAWHLVYTVFLSIVVLLLFLVTQQGASDYEVIKKETEKGIRILAATSCQDIGSKRCLDVLKVLMSGLSGVINIDIDSIERQTPVQCRQKPLNRVDSNKLKQDRLDREAAAAQNQRQNNEPRKLSLPQAVANSNRSHNHNNLLMRTSSQPQQHTWTTQPQISLSDLQITMAPNISIPAEQFEGFPSGFQSHTSDVDSHVDMLFNEQFAWPLDHNAYGGDNLPQPEMIVVDGNSQENTPAPYDF